jgi:uncharacterized protein
MTMTLEHKAGSRIFAPFELKAQDTGARTFEGRAAAFTLDTGGDVIHPGAFAKSLQDWATTGRVIPLLDNHPMIFQPQTHSVVRGTLGKMIEAAEGEDGLWAKFAVANTAAGNDLQTLLKDGMVEALSIGYKAVNPERDGNGVRHLREVKLQEISVVTWGMHPDTLIDMSSVKAALAEMDPQHLSDEDRRELRRLASRIGHLLRDAPPADAADAATDGKAVAVPEAPPEKADAPTADEAARESVRRELIIRELEMLARGSA